jgi:hydroxyacylglutathione hydrolase
VPAESLAAWAGFFVGDGEPVYLITDSEQLPANLKSLRSIGIDNIVGWFDAKAVGEAGLRSQSYVTATPLELKERIVSNRVQLLDVRAETEHRAERIPGSTHRFLGRLLRELPTIDRSKPVAVHCLGGGRSSIATSILQRDGFDVTNMQGGINAWKQAGLPTIKG